MLSWTVAMAKSAVGELPRTFVCSVRRASNFNSNMIRLIDFFFIKLKNSLVPVEHPCCIAWRLCGKMRPGNPNSCVIFKMIRTEVSWSELKGLTLWLNHSIGCGGSQKLLDCRPDCWPSRWRMTHRPMWWCRLSGWSSVPAIWVILLRINVLNVFWFIKVTWSAAQGFLCKSTRSGWPRVHLDPAD